MPYNIYKADGTVVVIPDNSVDSQFYNPTANGAGKGVGTQLIGRNAIDYGAPVAQNFLQLTENFCSSTVPNDITSLQGQTWFKKTSPAGGDFYVRVSSGTLLGTGINNWRKVFLDDGSGGVPASSLLGGGTGTVVYQSAINTTAFLPAGNSTQVLISGASPSWTHSPALSGVNFTDIPNSALVNGGIPPQVGTNGWYLKSVGGVAMWAAVGSGGSSGSGTVSSVNVSGGSTGLSVTGGPVTDIGVLTLGGTLAVSHGGTGSTSASAARGALGAAPTASPAFTGTVTIMDRSAETSSGDPNAFFTGTSVLDLTTSNYFVRSVYLSANIVFNSPPASGSAYAFTLEFIQQVAGIALTWPASVKWPNNLAPMLSTGGKSHLFFFVTRDGGTTWRGTSLVNYPT